MFYVLLYLGAVVAANLTVAHFGPSAVYAVGFALVGLDLTSRDHLHDAWHGRGLLWKMAALIATGSVLSYLLNRAAGPIAVASFAAFTCAAVVDALVYHVLRERARLVRVNGSNVLSAAVDSLVFPTLAFGGFAPLVTVGQFAAKVAGGFVWSLVLRQWEARRSVGSAYRLPY